MCAAQQTGNKARVRITYDLMRDGESEPHELPFVVGVMGDFSGNPTKPLEKLSDRDFVEINRDNFGEIMTKMRPELNIKVDDMISSGKEKKEAVVKLNFRSMKDFQPTAIASQIEPLKKLLDLRRELRKLSTEAANNDDIEALLREMASPALRAKLTRDPQDGDKTV